MGPTSFPAIVLGGVNGDIEFLSWRSFDVNFRKSVLWLLEHDYLGFVVAFIQQRLPIYRLKSVQLSRPAQLCSHGHKPRT